MWYYMNIQAEASSKSHGYSEEMLFYKEEKIC